MPTSDLPPLPGDEGQAQAHGARILRAAIAVAIANQERHEVAQAHLLGLLGDPPRLASLDALVAASAKLELAITVLTEACVDAQQASMARWS